MFKDIITWDIYEISPGVNSIVGVKFRGRLRKFCLENNRNCLAENAVDIAGKVRFAIPSGEEVSKINEFLLSIVPGIKIECVKTSIQNPVLSKLKVNIEQRYRI
jgi:hypothetical protein